MYAVEFQAKVTNGSIQIPDEFKDKISGAVKVIVLTQEKSPAADMIDRLLENPIKFDTFIPLTREEIYER